MKKKIYLLAGTLFVLSLCSCSIQTFTDGNHQESSSATTSSSSSEGNSSEVPSTPEISNRSDISISDSTADSPSATPDVISSSTSSSDSNESPSDTQVSPDTYTLTRYDSIYDVPYAKLDYKSYVEEDGDSGHYTLTKDGIPWGGVPLAQINLEIFALAMGAIFISNASCRITIPCLPISDGSV